MVGAASLQTALYLPNCCFGVLKLVEKLVVVIQIKKHLIMFCAFDYVSTLSSEHLFEGNIAQDGEQTAPKNNFVN